MAKRKKGSRVVKDIKDDKGKKLGQIIQHDGPAPKNRKKK